MKLLNAPSIQLRLILVFGTIALVGSCIAGTVLFKVLSYQVRHQEFAELTGKIELIKHLASLQENPVDVNAFSQSIKTLLGGHKHLKAWITDYEGVLIYGGSPPQMKRQISNGEFLVRTSDGSELRALRTQLRTDSLNYDLVVAINTKPGNELLYAFGTTLLAVCAAWVVCVSMFAAWAVRRSLSSIRQLSEQASRIRPEDLSIRLPIENIDTELRELSIAFNHTLDRVQEAYRQMEGFNADVAHELRTPLATLISGSEITLSRARSAEELRETVSSHLEELEMVQLMINDMLFLARADSGAAISELTSTSIGKEIAIVIDYYEAMLEESGVAVNTVGNAQVLANSRLIRRAISNLVSNAIKASPRGELITIGIHEDPEAIQIIVRNSGAGIPVDILSKIFDRFFRADSARTQRPEGHGLGLAIVKAIARMHGGETVARSGKNWSEVGFNISKKRLNP
ncbi:two-component sensor histidine kinase [Pollutimonas nitritireducens]|uniref:Sensor protein n=1 Tax=Pollutimonas nitritireducens TaxID=2045209 RepID=A0A2N4UD78_9BURK|nr:heavy metal sensor histidine kinase [Pollutimonas nitritireducens]PLC52963.1 two-component sensor histidine kinase [Pollutimonas nitritireducens]